VVAGEEVKLEPTKPVYIHDYFRQASGITYGGRGSTTVHKRYPSGPAPADKRARLAKPLPKDPITGKDQQIVALAKPFRFHCGGSCAFSTVGDYLRFAQMLLDGGTIGGQRVLSPKTVATMTSDHLGTGIRNQVAGVEQHRDGYGFGLGVAVRLHEGIAATPGSKGDYTWNGANGTLFWNDPRERLTVVVGTAAPGEIRKYYREQMGALVYGAMTASRPAP